MVIEQISVGPMENYAYLVGCEQQGKAMIIDPSGDVHQLLERLKQRGMCLEYIVNTHGHSDHTSGNAFLKRVTDAKVVVHRLDSAMVPGADLKVDGGDILRVGTVEAKVLHTPGHTPGSICLYVAGNLFTGDTLFVGAVGRTDLPGGDFGTLLQSIKDKLLPLPPDTVVWPGHNYGDAPSSSLSRECKTNPYITDFIMDT